MTNFDILGLGAVAVDDLIYVDTYPEPNSKTMVSHRERQCGGLTATALVAASRLGVQCSYAGTLGKDELSAYVIQTMQQKGIDLNFLVHREDARPVYSTVIVDEIHHTRNVLVDLHGVVGASTDEPSENIIRSCHVLFVDHIGIGGMIRAARIARQAGIPIVSDLEGTPPGFDELNQLVDHAIFSWDFAQSYTGDTSPTRALSRLWTPNRVVVAVTQGEEGCLYVERSRPTQIHHQPAFKVQVVDTTGCGDIFHGAYAAGLAYGMDVHQRFQFASAAAAIKATQRGGQAGAPTRSAVEEFIKQYQ